MDMLARWAGYLAIAGGGLIAVVVIIVTMDAESPAWFAFFLVILLLGGAVLGLERRTRVTTGPFGRWSAWLSVGGVLALLGVFAYAAATGGLSSEAAYDPATDPLTPLWIATAAAWFLGNIGYAVALLRGRALSAIGAWLVLGGAVIGLIVTAVLGENLPPAVTLLFGVFGLGWMFIGWMKTPRTYTP